MFDPITNSKCHSQHTIAASKYKMHRLAINKTSTEIQKTFYVQLCHIF